MDVSATVLLDSVLNCVSDGISADFGLLRLVLSGVLEVVEILPMSFLLSPLILFLDESKDFPSFLDISEGVFCESAIILLSELFREVSL